MSTAGIGVKSCRIESPLNAATEKTPECVPRALVTVGAMPKSANHGASDPEFSKPGFTSAFWAMAVPRSAHQTARAIL